MSPLLDLLLFIAELWTVAFVTAWVCARGIVARGNEHLYGVPFTPRYYTRAEARIHYMRDGFKSENEIEAYLDKAGF